MTAQAAIVVQPLLPESEPIPVALAPSAPVGGMESVIASLAANPQVDVTKLEKIIALQERILDHEARAAFAAAFARMQGDLPTVVERAKTNNGKYAPLEDIVQAVRPVLRKYGFALSHRTEWPDPTHVKVIGILSHEQGHEKTSEFLTTADSSGNKNAIQGYGSAVAYGRRYTTKDLLLIVTTGEDNDGATAGTSVPEPPTGFDDWCDAMLAVSDEGIGKLTDTWNASKKEFRDYANKYRQPQTAAWKDRAKKAGKGASRG